MSQPVLIKVYASLWPATQALAGALHAVTQAAIPARPEIDLAGSLLTLGFEGIFFPVDELISEVGNNASAHMQGKIDILDIENWQLCRYLVENGAITLHKAPLNNVLDYSGH